MRCALEKMFGKLLLLTNGRHQHPKTSYWVKLKHFKQQNPNNLDFLKMDNTPEQNISQKRQHANGQKYLKKKSSTSPIMRENANQKPQ